MRRRRLGLVLAIALPALILCVYAIALGQSGTIGRELAVPRHLRDGEEFKLSAADLVEFGRKLFTANWTDQDGGGRPLSKGTGQPLADRSQRLSGARAFNRLSGPDANSCPGCHVGPNQRPGGGGDFVANAFVMADRFDFVTFERGDTKPTRGAVDESGRPTTLQTVGNSRLTPGLWGAGYLEMLARQMTGDLRRLRDQIQPGQSKALTTKGISFGTLGRRSSGAWDTSRVTGLPPQSLTLRAPDGRPSLVLRPWRQSGSSVSLRDLTNTSLNAHHGIQSAERFGIGTDPDGDGVVNEVTRGDVTALTILQATLPVPGRVIPNDIEAERRILRGEILFHDIGCTTCHVPSLPLNRRGWIYSEPGPYNPPSSLRRTGSRLLEVDLTSDALPQPRLVTTGNPPVVQVPAYTDFKLHDITEPNDTSAKEPLDMNQVAGSAKFFEGNRRFLTRRLWGVASQPAHFHHGLFTTIKEAVLAHAGEALQQRRAFQGLGKSDQESILEFLNSLQVVPPDTRALIVDENYRPKQWPPARQF